jgi:hypothetical protein
MMKKFKNIRLYFTVAVLAVAGSVQAQFITNNGITIVNSATVTTNGEWVNTGDITNHGTIITSENWNNKNGVLSSTSTGGFILQYASTKTFAPGGTSFGFLQKEGTGNASVDGSFVVKDSASFKGGIVQMVNPANIITLGDGDDNFKLNASGTSYVDGRLIYNGKGDLFFPVGKGVEYLPIKFYKVSGENPTVRVIVEDSPQGFTAGPAVEALLGFPYVWNVTKGNEADTSSHVEISYAKALTATTTNPIVIRKTDGKNTYTGMGARSITNTDTRVTVRSYSRRLQGIFSIAKGFPGNLETDSLALVALFNAAGGIDWTNKTQWLTGDIDGWFGVTLTAQNITAVELPNNNVTGEVPEQVADINGLVVLDLSNNKIKTIPDLSTVSALGTVNVSNNNLDFASLLANVSIPGINYNNQAELGLPLDQLTDVGTDYKLKVITKGDGNIYSWKRNGTAVSNATDSTYIIAAIDRSNMGEYIAEVTNPNVPGLTLKTHTQRVRATATLSGKLLIDETTGASSGSVTLYRVTSGAFEKFEPTSVSSDGSYTLEKVVLDDYQLLGYADTLVYDNALPTYFKEKNPADNTFRRTIYWEEADTLFLNTNRNDLDILTQPKPTAPKDGEGYIEGVFTQDDGTGGGRGQKQAPVSRAGASIRRGERTGRPQEDIEYVLVAYIFTNEEGKFAFQNLEQGDYKINFQYPGYPMDETSDVILTIGASLKDRQANVNAEVKENKIVVRRNIITGWEKEQFTFNAYPNPATEAIFIRAATGSSREMKLNIIGIDGSSKLISPRYDGHEDQWIVDVSLLPKALYLLNVERKGSIETLKILIE